MESHLGTRPWLVVASIAGSNQFGPGAINLGRACVIALSSIVPIASIQEHRKSSVSIGA